MYALLRVGDESVYSAVSCQQFETASVIYASTPEATWLCIQLHFDCYLVRKVAPARCSAQLNISLT